MIDAIKSDQPIINLDVLTCTHDVHSYKLWYLQDNNENKYNIKPMLNKHQSQLPTTTTTTTATTTMNTNDSEKWKNIAILFFGWHTHTSQTHHAS